jgi:hypothetical protein
MMKVLFKNLENEDINKVVKHISNNVFKIGSVYEKVIARQEKQAHGEIVFEFLVDDSFRESNLGDLGFLGKLNNPSINEYVKKMNGLDIPVSLFVPGIDRYEYIIRYFIIDGDLCHHVKRG